jgi:uncharacterized protein YjbI with pentapeptide repeats
MAAFLLALAAAAQSLPPSLAAPLVSSCQAALADGDVDDLPGVDGATLSGAPALVALRRARGDAPLVVSRGDFRGADFRGARLHNLCFVDTNLSGSDWSGAQARGVGFVRADLSDARMARADLGLVFFRNAVLENVDARGAILRGGRLDGGWFDGSVANWRLDRADLTGFRFECGITLDDGCPVYRGEGEISFRGTNLTGANLFGRGDLTGARIDRTEVEPGRLRDLAGARIAGPIHVRGGDRLFTLSPADYRRVLPNLVDPATLGDEPIARGEAPGWARPGARVLFIDDARLVRPAFRDDPLFRAMVPVLVAASSSRVAVRVNADGSMDAVGDAIGGNAHLCSLQATGLRFDAASGWYTAPQAGSASEPERWRGRPMRVLQFSGDRAVVSIGARFTGSADADEDPRPSDFANCGARAGFSDMVRVPVTREQVDARLREEVLP